MRETNQCHGLYAPPDGLCSWTKLFIGLLLMAVVSVVISPLLTIFLSADIVYWINGGVLFAIAYWLNPIQLDWFGKTDKNHRVQCHAQPLGWRGYLFILLTLFLMLFLTELLVSWIGDLLVWLLIAALLIIAICLVRGDKNTKPPWKIE